MSASEIDGCLAQAGTAADRSNVCQLIIAAERLQKSSPGAAIVLRSQSNLGLLDNSGPSESSIATPGQLIFTATTAFSKRVNFNEASSSSKAQAAPCAR